MKKIAVVGVVGIPACYGGFETLVENLTKYSSVEFQYMVFCSSKIYKDKISSHNNAELYYIPLNANNYQSIFYDIFALIKCLWLKPDATLILGVSGCIFLPFYKLLSKSKIIVNIDGLEWRRNKWSKLAKLFLKLSEKMAVRFSDITISDNQAITNYVKSEYDVCSETIAYGGDHIVKETPLISNKEMPTDCYLSICRIEPENNSHLILEAFSRTNKKLVFVGNWEYSNYGKTLKKNYETFENITIKQPIYDEYELASIRKQSVGYIHGHSAGGTNPSLVEAMNSSKAIVAYDCTFNRFTMEDKGQYFSNVEDLIQILTHHNVHSLDSNSRDMMEIAERKYKWELIVKEYESLYID